MISLGFGICRNDIGGELFYDVPGSEVHFLFLNAELPGGCLPHVDSRIFPTDLDGYGAEPQGTGWSPFQNFFLGVVPGVYQAEAGDAHFHLPGVQGGFPCQGNGYIGSLVFHHGIGCRINGLGRSRVGIQLFPAAVARGGRRSFRSGGNVEIQGSGKCLRVFAEDHVAVNPPAVRVLGHFFGDYRKGRLESGFFRLGDHFRQDEAARIAIGLHGRTGEFFLKDFPGIAYFRRCQIQNRLCTFPLGGPPGSWVQVADGVAAQGGAVIQHFLNLGGAHGRTAARDEFGVWENGKGESRFFQDGIGVRVDALPAVVDGDHDAVSIPEIPSWR